MKPRVMSLVLFTCFVGLILAPGKIGFIQATISLFAVSLGAGAAGALNMWYESDLDALMSRTCLRPIPIGKIKKRQALIFGVILSIISILLLYISSNIISYVLLFATICFYYFVYTVWLKRKTPQNIVIGGAAGALPPVIGWTITTGSLSIEPLVLFLLIFLWTPSHFWALSLYKSDDYKRANIPMLPLISGIDKTKLSILVYSILMLVPILLIYYLNLGSLLSTSISLMLTIYYVYLCFVLTISKTQKRINKIAKKIFTYSILYLFLLFLLLLINTILVI